LPHLVFTATLLFRRHRYDLKFRISYQKYDDLEWVRLSRRFAHIQTQSLKKIVLLLLTKSSFQIYLPRVVLFGLSQAGPISMVAWLINRRTFFTTLRTAPTRRIVLLWEITSTYFFSFFFFSSSSRILAFILPLARIRRNSFAHHSRIAISVLMSLRCSFAELCI